MHPEESNIMDQCVIVSGDDALATAIDLLAAVPLDEHKIAQRKLIVVFSDGINADMDPRIFRIGPMGIGQNFVELPARPRKVA